MKWDTVEREFFILGNQMKKIGESFQALAAELARERRERATLGGMSKDDLDADQEKSGGAQPPLAF